MPSLTTLNLKETEIHHLIGKSLKSTLRLPQHTLFYEMPIQGSRADIVYFQSPRPYETILSAGIHVFEVKMRYDKDKKRLKKQLLDYLTCSEYVWVIGVNKIPTTDMDNVGLMVFSTASCQIKIIREPYHDGNHLNGEKRGKLLDTIYNNLWKKCRVIRDMLLVQPVNGKIQIQKRLICENQNH